MIYVGNAFSLQMVDLSKEIDVNITPITSTRVLNILGDEYVSCVGHADTANVFGSLLGLFIPTNRISIDLKKGDTLIVGQVTGGRLPEGTTVLPKGMAITWLKVIIK